MEWEERQDGVEMYKLSHDTEPFAVCLYKEDGKAKWSLELVHFGECKAHAYAYRIGGQGDSKVLMALRPALTLKSRWMKLETAKEQAEKMLYDVLILGCGACQ